ncbi:hypothetical protein FACS189499_01630 [Clostridia bacterium]|nr:hypothetical protein FACS189499_01630 [Clostridia bacterium]
MPILNTGITDAAGATSSLAENRERYAQYFTDKSGDEMSMDTFYKLLSAEMSNQDPMEPMSNTEFISQMASFTSLQTQKDALYYSNANYAQSLVGKTVTVASYTAGEFKTESGIVTSMNLAGGDFHVKVNGKDYAMKDVMEVMPSSNPFAVSSTDLFYASALIGKRVSVSSKNAEGADIGVIGLVQRVEVQNGAINVVVDDMAFPLDAVLIIEDAATGSMTDTPSTGGTDTETPGTDNSGVTTPGGTTTEDPDAASNPGGTTTEDPDAASNPGGTTTTDPNAGTTTPDPNAGTTTPAAGTTVDPVTGQVITP